MPVPNAENDASQASETTNSEVITTETQTPPADSSSASVAKGDASPAPEAPKNIGDVVRNVLTESRKEAAKKAEAASSPDAKPNEQKPSKDEGKSEPGKPESKDEPPFHKHPRWVDLNTKYKTANAEVERLTAQTTLLQPLAEIGKSVQQFMAENHVSEDEFKYGQAIMGLMKTDPEAAMEVIEDLRDRLSVHLGRTLPKDLQDRVEAGEVSEAAAKELLQARSKGAAAEARATQLETSKSTEAQQRTATEIKTETTKWWTEIKGKDPDVDKIADMVNDKLTAIVAAHRSKADAPAITAVMARQFCQDAYDAVKAKLKSIVPPKPTVQPLRSETTNQSPAQASTAPKTMLDVTRSVLARTRGGG